MFVDYEGQSGVRVGTMSLAGAPAFGCHRGGNTTALVALSETRPWDVCAVKTNVDTEMK